MSNYYIYHDRKRCIGCRACEVHCMSNHQHPVGVQLNAIVGVTAETANPIPRTEFVYMHCYHCQDAACVRVCPTGAMHKREQDGIVHVKESLCIGCKSCIGACEWGAPQWDARKGKVVKCDFCMDRLDAGERPACVTKCAVHALHWVSVSEVAKIKRTRVAMQVVQETQEAV